MWLFNFFDCLKCLFVQSDVMTSCNQCWRTCLMGWEEDKHMADSRLQFLWWRLHNIQKHTGHSTALQCDPYSPTNTFTERQTHD